MRAELVVGMKPSRARLLGLQWLSRNHCAGKPRREIQDFVFSIPGFDTVIESFDQCLENAKVEFWTIKSYTSKHHSPHVPFFLWSFSDAVLDFLLSHHLGD